ncbi:MAG: hypothetical protein QXQ14_00415 [Candidatus Aenigmatarchaeota archaeon]
MKIIEIVLTIIFGIIILVLIVSFLFNSLFKSEQKEKVFYRKEDFLLSINSIISNCLKINENKNVLCFLAEYKGKEEFELPKIENAILEVSKVYPNQKIAFIYLPEKKVLITNYDVVK